MNCSFCGKYVAEGQRFCPNCGAVIEQPKPVQQPGYQQGGYQQGGYQQGGYQQGGYQQGGYQQGGYQQGGYQQGGYNTAYQTDVIGDNSNLIEVYKHVMKNYATFSGRARRREYWLFILANFIVQVVLQLFGSVFSALAASAGSSFLAAIGVIFTVLSYIYNLGIIVPSLALCWRRLHDIGKPGGFYFMGLIPLAGPIIMLVYFCTDSQMEENRFGPCPKGRM